ncbi:membrane bound cation [Fusarium sporotrichioides]|uniref:Membrane bound cation n=1 Tax=Fusarium sporotrichioides TaxID=5514 RepID=A0A395SEU6_FUSSP|nr:membrane bound cation [Fusarium sporotrichioides]
MSRISALLVLLIYVLYFIHEIRSRSIKGNETGPRDHDLENGSAITHPHLSFEHRSSSLASQHPPSRTIRFADDDSRERRTDSIYKLNDVAELETIEPADVSDSVVDRGRRSGETSRTSFSRPCSYQPLLNSRRHSRSLSITSSRGFQSRDSSMSREGRRTTAIHRLREHRASMDQLVHHQPHSEKIEPDWKASVAMLVITSVLMSMCGEFLVSTIDDITHQGGLSEGLIGLVILPIVGNVAEYVTVVAVAVRGNLDLAIAVAVGSAIQIALCISPLTVMAGWAMQKNLDLTFNTFEMVTLAGTVLLVNLLILNDGSSSLKTSGLKGALMCACYVIFGLKSYLGEAIWLQTSTSQISTLRNVDQRIYNTRLAIWKSLVGDGKIASNRDSGNILMIHGPCSLSISTPSHIVPITVIGEPPSCNGMDISEGTVTYIGKGIMVFKESSVVLFEFYSACTDVAHVPINGPSESSPVVSIRQAITRFW